MKELLKHRIDVLMEKAKAGDASAQFKLAKEFKKGCIVEKSLDNARYWAFKAISSGNSSAISFYNSIASDYQVPLTQKVDNILSYIVWIPLVEFIGAIIFFVILPNDIITNTVLGWFLCVGLISLLLILLASKINNKFSNQPLTKRITTTIVAIIHIIGLIIACS